MLTLRSLTLLAASAVVVTTCLAPAQDAVPNAPQPSGLFRRSTPGPAVAPAADPFAPGLPQAPGVSSNPFSSMMGTRVRSRTSAAEAPVRKKIQKELATIREAKDDAAREKATSELKAHVEKLFDVRTDEREAQIKDLEERVQRLRSQLDKRRSARSEIVRLHLQTLVNDALGLGF